MAWFKIEYDNGYCGNDHEEIMEFDTEADAEAYAEEGLDDWGDSNCIGVQGYSFGSGWDSEEEKDDYFENLSYSVTEVFPGKCGQMPSPCGEPLEGDCEDCSECE